MRKRMAVSGSKGDGGRLKAFASVASEFAGWAPGRDVLTDVTSVPTVFPQFDVATRVGGFPLQRVTLVHGPSNHGKTTFMLGAGKSFLARGHMYFHVDAEMTTPKKWVKENLRQFEAYPSFLAIRPRDYEETARAVRTAAEKLVRLREAGDIPEDTVALFGIDSLQKLVPRNLLEALLKDAGKDSPDAKNKGKEIDPLKGRAGMYQAALNTAWMKELIPLLYHCNAGLLLLARESQNTERVNEYSPEYKVNGGNAVYYDSSLVIRITRDSWVTQGPKDKPVVIGERHEGVIMKTKVGHKNGKVTLFNFHTSNGVASPAGLDRARDVVELGLHAGTLKRNGSTIYLAEGGDVLGVGENKAVITLVHNEDLLNELQTKTLKVAQPIEQAELPELPSDIVTSAV